MNKIDRTAKIISLERKAYIKWYDRNKFYYCYLPGENHVLVHNNKYKWKIRKQQFEKDFKILLY